MTSSSTPAITVVIPARDERRYVGAAIASVLSQHGEPPELLVVDDGSRDDTASVARRALERARGRGRVIAQAAAGLSAARNRGLDEARAPLVLFLDADDRLRPTALAHLRARLLEDPAALACYGEAQPVDEDGADAGAAPPPLFAPRPSGDVLAALLARNFVATMGAVLFRRDALVEAGRFAPDLHAREDWELLCRVAARGPLRYAGPAVVVEKRRRRESVSATFGDRIDELLAAVERVYSSPDVRARFSSSELARLRQHQVAFIHALSGLACLRGGRAREARRHLARALWHDPRRPREWLLLLCALYGRLPAPLAWRLQ